MTADVTAMVAQRASAAAVTTGMGLRASSETDVTYLKRIYSAEQGAAYAPKLTVTYRRVSSTSTT